MGSGTGSSFVGMPSISVTWGQWCNGPEDRELMELRVWFLPLSVIFFMEGGGSLN